MEINISGNVVDIGSNRGATYLSYIKKADGTTVEGFDLKESKGVGGINFETDPLPREEGSADHVLMFNILEHIFHYQFLVNECARILIKEGKITGFVPFLVNYHPDPHDYFRYTFEALTLILKEAGFINVRVAEVGKGPFMVNLNNFVPSLSRYVCVAIFPIYYLLDSILLLLRPNIGKRYPLGYIFFAEK
jgi:SAM-dependent methyltransferase